VDDLLVGSKSVSEHRRHLLEVLHRLQENGLLLNEEKCVFGRDKIEFFGHS
jgi:hypothetical protein